MRHRNLFRVLIALVMCALAVPLFGTTGFPTVLKCPLCGEKNVLFVWASYGSYIFQWPSKFQLIFWPHTDPLNLFLCTKCHFTAFSDDWQQPPKDKLNATRQVLARVIAPIIPNPEFAPKDEEEDKQWKRMVYAKVPMRERLEIAEAVYAQWGRDDEWWCHFYRVKGYHLQREKLQAEADIARQKALDLALNQSQDPSKHGQRKDLKVLIAAMRHYLRQDQAALADLEAAAALTYKNPQFKDEQNKNYDGYLSALIKEYISAIKEGRSTDEKESPD